MNEMVIDGLLINEIVSRAFGEKAVPAFEYLREFEKTQKELTGIRNEKARSAIEEALRSQAKPYSKRIGSDRWRVLYKKSIDGKPPIETDLRVGDWEKDGDGPTFDLRKMTFSF